MRTLSWLLKKRHYLYIAGLLFGAAVLLGNGVDENRTSAQAVDSIYVTPAAGSYTVGNNFTVSVRVNTTDQVNAAGADLTYSNNLEYVSNDGSGSAFGIDAHSTGGSGTVSLSRATITAVSGDQLVAKVTFKVLAAGSGVLTMQSSSQALSSTTNQNVLTAQSGGSFSLQAAASATPATPPATPPVKTTTPPAAVSKPSSTTTKATTDIAPQGNPTPTPLPGDSNVELKAPATVETTPNPNKQVSKVEYRLNGKLVKTDTTPPYDKAIDTTKLRNGTYTLTTKTYYKDGTVDSSKVSLTASNPFGPTQLWLQLRHYAWLVAILLVIIGELLYLAFFRNRRPRFKAEGGRSGGTDGDIDTNIALTGHGTVVVGGTTPPTTIQPSATTNTTGNSHEGGA
jgi:hypothetical protein